MKILFQGDSITDAGRDRDNPHNLGQGYPKYAAEMIQARHPDTEFEFIDLGISGNKVEDLRNRWQADCIDIQPDVVSILIGVNDTWHHAGAQDWIPNETFEADYRAILTDIKEKTKAKIIILEQFLLPTGEKDWFRADLDPKIQVVRKLAREFADVYIPTDGIFAAACIGTKPETWAADAVHPSEVGAKLIAEKYADAFDLIYRSI